MRDIKFRYWHLKWKRFEDAGYMFDSNGFQARDYIIPLQYTGLKDCQGVEIYEGDIVEASGYKYPMEIRYGKHESGADGIYSIDDFGFYGSSKAPNWDGYFDVNILNVVNGKVIGNIYENPELLEGTKSND